MKNGKCLSRSTEIFSTKSKYVFFQNQNQTTLTNFNFVKTISKLSLHAFNEFYIVIELKTCACAYDSESRIKFFSH